LRSGTGASFLSDATTVPVAGNPGRLRSGRWCEPERALNETESHRPRLKAAETPVRLARKTLDFRLLTPDGGRWENCFRYELFAIEPIFADRHCAKGNITIKKTA